MTRLTHRQGHGDRAEGDDHGGCAEQERAIHTGMMHPTRGRSNPGRLRLIVRRKLGRIGQRLSIVLRWQRQARYSSTRRRRSFHLWIPGQPALGCRGPCGRYRTGRRVAVPRCPETLDGAARHPRRSRLLPRRGFPDAEHRDRADPGARQRPRRAVRAAAPRWTPGERDPAAALRQAGLVRPRRADGRERRSQGREPRGSGRARWQGSARRRDDGCREALPGDAERPREGERPRAHR